MLKTLVKETVLIETATSIVMEEYDFSCITLILG